MEMSERVKGILPGPAGGTPSFFLYHGEDGQGGI